MGGHPAAWTTSAGFSGCPPGSVPTPAQRGTQRALRDRPRAGERRGSDPARGPRAVGWVGRSRARACAPKRVSFGEDRAGPAEAGLASDFTWFLRTGTFWSLGPTSGRRRRRLLGPGPSYPAAPPGRSPLGLGQMVPGEPPGRGLAAGRGVPAKFGRQPSGAAVSRELAGGAQLRAAALPGRRRRRSAQARRAGFPGLQPAPAPPCARPPPCAMAGCAARAPPGSEARLSLATFLLGASVLALPLLTRAGLQGRTALALYVAGLNALLLLLYRPPRYQVQTARGRRRGGGAMRVAPSPRGGARKRGCLLQACCLAASSGGRRDPASPGSGDVGRGPAPPGGVGGKLQLVRFGSCDRCAGVGNERAHGSLYVI